MEIKKLKYKSHKRLTKWKKKWQNERRYDC